MVKNSNLERTLAEGRLRRVTDALVFSLNGSKLRVSTAGVPKEQLEQQLQVRYRVAKSKHAMAHAMRIEHLAKQLERLQPKELVYPGNFISRENSELIYFILKGPEMAREALLTLASFPEREMSFRMKANKYLGARLKKRQKKDEGLSYS